MWMTGHLTKAACEVIHKNIEQEAIILSIDKAYFHISRYINKFVNGHMKTCKNFTNDHFQGHFTV